MTTKLRTPISLLLIVFISVIACYVLLLLGGTDILRLFAQPSGYVAMAQSRIEIGETRESAVSKLTDALTHYQCESSRGAVDDLFFYGTSDPEQAVVLFIRSDFVESQLTVTSVGTIENYLLPAFYGECLGLEFPPE